MWTHRRNKLLIVLYLLWSRKMPERCVVGGCSNCRDIEKGISLHVIPFYGDDRPEAKRWRKTWVDFVARKHAKWNPTQWSVICSYHFMPDDFSYHLSVVQERNDVCNCWLKRDELGVSMFPTVYERPSEEPSARRRDRRMLIINICVCFRFSWVVVLRL